MALIEKLELLINADPAQGVAAMQRFAAESDKNLSSVEGRIKSFGKNALKVGAAGIGAGGFLTQMASEDIEAANQLKAAIEQTGGVYSDFADRIDEAASAQVRYGHTDDEVNNALSALTLAYGDAGKALDQMQLVADLAARKHISLEEAANLVGKAHNGAARIFKEFGVQVGLNADGTKNFDGALTDLAQKLTGQADAAADTFTGRLKALGAQASNIASEFGQKFGPAILGLSTGLTALGGVTSGVSSVLEHFKKAEEGATVATEGLAVATNTSLLASLGAVAPVAAPVIGVLGILGKSYLDSQDKQASAAQTVRDYTAAILDENGALQANVDKITAQKIIESGVTPLLSKAGISARSFADEVRNADDRLVDFANQAKQTSPELGTFNYTLRQLKESGDPFTTSLIAMYEQGKLTWREVQKLADNARNLNLEFGEGTKKAQEQAAALAVVKEITDATTASTNGLAGALASIPGIGSIVGSIPKTGGGVARPRAMGGSGLPGQSYFIEPGTHGEFFTPTTTGWFTPKDKMAGSAQGGDTYHLYGSDPAETAELVSRTQRRKLILSRR